MADEVPADGGMETAGPPAQVDASGLAAVRPIRPKRYCDDRGWFEEVWSADTMRTIGLDVEFCQENQSLSWRRGTIRGLHYQQRPHAQGKLLRVVSGAIFDVAVDLRRSSETFGQHTEFTLTATEGNQLWIPEGFAHGFCSLEDETILVYKVAAPYAPTLERVLRFDDPALGIEWPIERRGMTINDRDRDAPTLAELRAAGELFP